MRTNGPVFRTLLRHWRKMRRFSQLALAEEAGISIRHLSFLETARSLPSRDMVERLAEALDVPSVDRNVLLLSAGYAPTHVADDVEAIEFDAHERMLEAIVSQKTPFPTLVIDGGWNIRMRNAAAERVFGRFRASYRLPDGVAGNALHILCHPDGLRRFMPNWREYAKPFLREIDREASMMPGSDADVLRDALHAYPGIADAADLSEERAGGLTMRLQTENTLLSFHTAFTTFALPSVFKPRQVRIECLYPADTATARCLPPA